MFGPLLRRRNQRRSPLLRPFRITITIITITMVTDRHMVNLGTHIHRVVHTTLTITVRRMHRRKLKARLLRSTMMMRKRTREKKRMMRR